MSTTRTEGGYVMPRDVVVLGVFGIPGSGVTALLKQLEGELDPNKFNVYYGTRDEMIKLCNISPVELTEVNEPYYRKMVIGQIQDELRAQGKTGIVGGHLVLWKQGQPRPNLGDQVERTPDPIREAQYLWARPHEDIFTHVVFLDLDVREIARRRDEGARGRLQPRKVYTPASISHLQAWKDFELTELKRISKKCNIRLEILGVEHHNKTDLVEVVHYYTNRYMDKEGKKEARRRAADQARVSGPIQLTPGQLAYIEACRFNGNAGAHLRTRGFQAADDVQSCGLPFANTQPADSTIRGTSQALVVHGTRHADTTSTTDGTVTVRASNSQAIVPDNGDHVQPPTKQTPDISIDDVPPIVRSRVKHATLRTGARLLLTPLRNSALPDAALREAQARVGYYLATEFAAEQVGVEALPLTDRRGQAVKGYRLRGESDTAIMSVAAPGRAGPRIAAGVKAAFPLAAHLGAWAAEDIVVADLAGRRTVVVVDSLIDDGDAIFAFVKRLYEIRGVRIVLVAAEVTVKAILEGRLASALEHDGKLTVACLRLY